MFGDAKNPSLAEKLRQAYAQRANRDARAEAASSLRIEKLKWPEEDEKNPYHLKPTDPNAQRRSLDDDF